MNKYIFGPVPSRRLGRSLGIDLVPFKTCSYDCIYCQLGRTTDKTIERKQRARFDRVLDELKENLHTRPDYITLSGSGEPTLCSDLGALISSIRSMTEIPVAVLTNGSLLWQEDLRRELADAHLVVPSLDAAGQEMFNAVNRPHPEISFEQMLDGLVAFRQQYRGLYWLEIMLLAGHTGITTEIMQLAALANRIKPDAIHLNTVARPPAEQYAIAVPHSELERFAAAFQPRAQVAADTARVHQQPEFAATRRHVLLLLRRRPCTLEDVATGLGLHRNQAAKFVQELIERKQAAPTRVGDATYYKSTNGAKEAVSS